MVFIKKIKMVLKHCINCLFPETKPDLSFNEEGLLAHVRLQLIKTKILIGKREKEFLKLLIIIKKMHRV